MFEVILKLDGKKDEVYAMSATKPIALNKVSSAVSARKFRIVRDNGTIEIYPFHTIGKIIIKKVK